MLKPGPESKRIFEQQWLPSTLDEIDHIVKAKRVVGQKEGISKYKGCEEIRRALDLRDLSLGFIWKSDYIGRRADISESAFRTAL